MELKELLQKAKEVKEKLCLTSSREWKVQEYVDGFVADVGDLVKLVMAKNKFRRINEVDKKLAHELSDCLY